MRGGRTQGYDGRRRKGSWRRRKVIAGRGKAAKHKNGNFA